MVSNDNNGSTPVTQSVTANPLNKNLFIGRTVVVTGTLEHFTRDSINAKIESMGAKAGKRVSKNTNYLIYGNKTGSKLDKAQALGIAVLSEQDFRDMVNNVGELNDGTI